MTYTVTFVDYDNAIIETVSVKSGEAATAPEAPSRDGYRFIGWDKSFDNVTSSIVVKALYEEVITEPTIMVESVEVARGADSVTFAVRLINNPGVMNATLVMTFDEDVFEYSTSGVKRGDALPSATLTKPGAQSSGTYCFLLDAQELTEEDAGDGVLYTITLGIKDKNAVGSYTIDFESELISDENLEDITNIVIVDGIVTIK